MCMFERETACGLLREDVKWIVIILQLIYIFLLSLFSTYMSLLVFFSSFNQKACCFQLVFSNLVSPKLGNFSVHFLRTWPNYFPLYALPIGQSQHQHEVLTSQQLDGSWPPPLCAGIFLLSEPVAHVFYA